MRDTYFDSLSMRAREVGAVVVAERDASGWGFWLLDKETQDGVWADDNFSTSLYELDSKITRLEKVLELYASSVWQEGTLSYATR